MYRQGGGSSLSPSPFSSGCSIRRSCQSLLLLLYMLFESHAQVFSS
jgi:hypothetical protein